MKYQKPALSTRDQCELLQSRGFLGNKRDIERFLSHFNYYRLTGYLYVFRRNGDTFREGTNLETIQSIIHFDEELRNVTLLALGIIEISFKTVLTNLFSAQHGAFGYLDSSCLPQIKSDSYADWIDRIRLETSRSKEEFVKRYFRKYGDSHKDLPLWMASDVMSFGNLVTMYRGVAKDLKREMARRYGVPDVVLHSWIVGLNGVRNVCAHHGRLYNRRLGYAFKLPYQRKYPEWHVPCGMPNRSSFAALTICAYLLRRIGLDSEWNQRIVDLFDHYKAIPEIRRVFPANWRESPIWEITVHG